MSPSQTAKCSTPSLEAGHRSADDTENTPLTNPDIIKSLFHGTALNVQTLNIRI